MVPICSPVFPNKQSCSQMRAFPVNRTNRINRPRGAGLITLRSATHSWHVLGFSATVPSHFLLSPAPGTSRRGWHGRARWRWWGNIHTIATGKSRSGETCHLVDVNCFFLGGCFDFNCPASRTNVTCYYKQYSKFNLDVCPILRCPWCLTWISLSFSSFFEFQGDICQGKECCHNGLGKVWRPSAGGKHSRAWPCDTNSAGTWMSLGHFGVSHQSLQ